MMKKFILAVITAASFALTANAAPTVSFSSFTTGGGLDAASFSVDPSGSVYDTIDFTFTATTPGTFNNNGTADTFSIATSEFTVFDGLLAAINSFTPFGLSVDGNTLSGTYATLGNDNISSNIFTFGQIVATAGNAVDLAYTLNFADDGTQVDSVSGVFPGGGGNPAVPEPSTFAVGLALAGLVIARKRFQK